MPGLGRLPSPDIRDKNFLMRRKLAAPGTVMPVSKTWPMSGISLDQKETSTCVGHAWKNFLRCAPMRTEKGPSPFDIYREAVKLDGFPENDNEATLPDFDPGLASGTSVRAGAEAVTNSGRLKSYLWAFDLQSVIEWVLTKGPVVLGVNWYGSMSTPDKEGIARIAANSRIDGGHSFLLRGGNTKRALGTCENSWGDGWSKKGTFYLPFADLERLIHEDGESCTAIQTKLVPANPKPIPT
jgi:hypothetical protein